MANFNIVQWLVELPVTTLYIFISMFKQSPRRLSVAIKTSPRYNEQVTHTAWCVLCLLFNIVFHTFVSTLINLRVTLNMLSSMVHQSLPAHPQLNTGFMQPLSGYVLTHSPTKKATYFYGLGSPFRHEQLGHYCDSAKRTTPDPRQHRPAWFYSSFSLLNGG
jgi:hypothetical protein